MMQQFQADEWHFASQYRTDFPKEEGNLGRRLHSMMNLRFFPTS
jgi:hypothetical protein